jgi:ABC-type sugar transport system substrate-binding protein
MKTKQIITGLVILIIGVLLGLSMHGHQAKAEVNPTTKRVYAMNTYFSSWAGWQPTINMLKQMSDTSTGFRASFGGPLDSDISKQIEELDCLIDQKINGIIIQPSDPKALNPTINKAFACGIPFVTIFGDAQDSKRLTYVAANERESARRLMEKVIESTKNKFESHDKVKVVICTGRMGVPTSDLRMQGIKDALASNSKMRLVDVLSDDVDETKAVELISAAFERCKGIDIMVGVEPRSAIGAIAVAKERHLKPGDITITAWDMDGDVLLAIKDGWIEATSVLNIPLMTQTCLSILEAYNMHYAPTFPDRIDIPQTYVDKTNVDKFLNAQK